MMNGFGTSEITFCLTKNLDKSGVAIAAVLRGSPTLLKIAACSTFAKGGSQADQFFPPPLLSQAWSRTWIGTYCGSHHMLLILWRLPECIR